MSIGGLRARTTPWFFSHFWKCSEVVDNYFWRLSKMAEKSRGHSCSEPFNCMKDIKQYSVHSFTRSSDWYFVSVQDRNHTFWQWFLCWNLWWKYDKVILLERGKNLYQLQHPVKVQKSKFVLWKVRKWHNLVTKVQRNDFYQESPDSWQLFS